MHGLAEEEFLDALLSLNLRAMRSTPAEDGHDLTLDVDGRATRLQLKFFALVDLPRALYVIDALQQERGSQERVGDLMTVVAGDRIVERARAELKRAGISWFDRRGHLFLRAPGLLVDTPVSSENVPARRGSGARVKLATAVDLLLHAPMPLAVRETARRIGAAPSSISAVSKSLRAEGILQPGGSFDVVALFWVAAGLWKPTWTSVDRYPHPESAMRNPALRLGFEDPTGPGWALGGDLAAAHLGAPMALRSGASPDLYIPTAQAHRLAVSILGRTGDKSAARLAVPPVRAVCERRIDVASGLADVWLVARPLFVAFDLASDPGRGVEMLDSWDPSPWGTRVW